MTISFSARCWQYTKKRYLFFTQDTWSEKHIHVENWNKKQKTKKNGKIIPSPSSKHHLSLFHFFYFFFYLVILHFLIHLFIFLLSFSFLLRLPLLPFIERCRHQRLCQSTVSNPPARLRHTPTSLHPTRNLQDAAAATISFLPLLRFVVGCFLLPLMKPNPGISNK